MAMRGINHALSSIKIFSVCYRGSPVLKNNFWRPLVSVVFTLHARCPRTICSKVRENIILGRRQLSSGSQFHNAVAFEAIVDETLEDLSYFFETLGDEGIFPDDFDVQLADGVLTVNMGGGLGTYVINKQTPNKQIWLSSPLSGPKRYDYIDGGWVYSHDRIRLHRLLSRELSQILERKIDFTQLAHSGHENGNTDS